MSDRTKLTLASLALMMLPYRIDFPVTVLIVTAIVCMAIDMASSPAFLFYHSLKSRTMI
jgi:hypothetical protein